MNTVKIEKSTLAEVQGVLNRAMRQANLSRSKLAVKMGKSPSRVTSMLDYNRSLTIRSIARTLAACGYKVKFNLEKID